MALESGSNIDALLAPRSIAVVGASPTSFVGRILLQNLRDMRFEGPVYPVNPRYDQILEWPCFPSVEELPEGVEAVVAAVRPQLVADVLRAAGGRGARAAVVPGGGFSETGQAALDAQREIAAVAAEFGLAVAGPNCMGVIAPGRAAMYIGTLTPTLLEGPVAVVSQSGSVIEAMVNMGPRVGFSALVSCGTETVTTVGRYLRYFAGDERTSAVAVFVEGFRDPAGFVDGAKAMREAGKPLVVLQAGRSKEQAAAIAAHSGSLAGTDEVVTGLLHQVGAMGADDLDELIETCELLARGRLPAGRRTFVVTDSGGEANLIADHARWQGLELPPPSDGMKAALQERWPNFSFIANPVDPWGVDPDFDPLYGEIMRLAGQEDVDVVAMALDKITPWPGENELDLGMGTARALIEGTKGTPSLPVYFSLHSIGPAAEPVRELLRSEGVPLLQGLRPALVAIARTAWWQSWTPRTSAEESQEVIPLPPIDEPGPVLSERTSRDVLAAYGVPVAEAELAASPPEAARAAERLGFPVVIKADAPGVAHKAAAGLVRTGVATPEQAEEAAGQVMDAARATGAEPRGVLVEATLKGVELIAGMRRDPAFGPVVLLGVGGALTEVLHEVSVRLCPPSPEDLAEMPNESAAGKLLAASNVDPGPVLDVVGRLSRLALEHPEVLEVDVNPLFAWPGGAAAGDALVILEHDEGGTKS